MSPPVPVSSVYRFGIAAYDWLYRVSHGLTSPESEIGPVLRVEIRKSRRAFRLGDGTIIRPGDRIGYLHLNNDRVGALGADGLPPVALGLAFRKRLLASFGALAEMCRPGGRFADVTAFQGTTIFHEGLNRLGFETEPDGLRWPRLVGAYQRALLASMHPRRPVGLQGPSYQHAERVWISREQMLARYGGEAFRPTG